MSSTTGPGDMGRAAPIRVAQVIGTVGSSGAESHVLTLLAAFDPREVAATLFVPGEGPLVDRLRARGIAVELGAPTRKLALGEAWVLGNRWRGAFDVVHAHGPRVAFWSARAARRARVPAFVVTQHETRLNTLPPGLKRTVWVGLEEWALARADAILPVSEATARDLAQRRPDLAGRIHVVHGSAPMLLEADALPRAQPARRAGESLRLVTVGRFSFEKGYDRLLESLALLAGRGLDFGLDVVGHGDLESEMRARVGRLGLEPRVRWHTGGLGLPALLARAHLYVTASRNEGLSVAALEAMAIGLPIVATDVGGMPELVVDGVTGILVSGHPEASLPERFAEAVARAAADPEGARRMGEAAARRARGTFGPARMAETITACYRALLARREPATDETRIEGRTS